jgi:hypothetical protein
LSKPNPKAKASEIFEIMLVVRWTWTCVAKPVKMSIAIIKLKVIQI